MGAAAARRPEAVSSLDHAAGSRGSIRIAAGVEVGDCSGRTIAAGFWNSHVHFADRKEGARAAFAEAACAVRTIAAGTREDSLREGFLGLPGVREVLEALPPAEPGVTP
jgi:hypothetical protein